MELMGGRGISSLGCTRLTMVSLGQIKGGIKAVWGSTSMEIERQGNKRGQLHANRLMVNTLLWSCPVPGYQRLFCLLTKFHFYFPGGGTVYPLCVCTCVLVYGGQSASNYNESMGHRDPGDSRAGGYSK